MHGPAPEVTDRLRTALPGTPLVVNPAGADVTRDGLEALLADGRADLVAVGRAFISNPDLVARLADGAALAEGDPSTFYGGTEVGYVDYPRLDGTV